MSKKYTTDNITISESLNDGSGVGTSGQVLSSTGTGVSWINGSAIAGGPYLALTGGTLTGVLTVSAASADIYITSTSGSEATLYIGRSVDTQARITSGDTAASDLCFYIGGVRGLTMLSGGAATFAGTIASGAITSTGTVQATSFISTVTTDSWILKQLSGTNRGLYFAESTGQWQFYDSGAVKASISKTGNATFAGTIASGAITSTGNVTGKVASFQSPDATSSIVANWMANNGNNAATFRTTASGHVFEIVSQNSGTLKFDSPSAVFTGALTVAGKISGVTAGTANTDAVNLQQLNNATTGVLLYQGVWNASTNNPTLDSGSGTPGYYYIVSVDGATDLDGITDWKVGDWAVFSDIGTEEWQKIDNTSILGGAGTGGTVAKWSGSGTSLTLGNSGIADASNAVAITINGNEEVGIGGSPFRALDVFGTFGATGASTFGGTVSSGAAAAFNISSTSGKLSFANDPTNYYIHYKDSSDGIVVSGYYGASLAHQGNIKLKAGSGGVAVTGTGSFTGDVTLGTTSDTVDRSIKVLSGDTKQASLEAYGDSQGTGVVYVGQSDAYGGGIVYNGDGSPAFGNVTTDTISFYRRESGTNYEVFRYGYGGSTVTFAGTLAVSGTGNSSFAGNLGVGVTGPISKLHTYTNVNDSTFQGITVQNNATSGARSGIAFKGYDWVQSAIWHGRTVSPSTESGALVLGTNPNTTDLTVGGVVGRMWIINNGNVGVGVSSPAAKLEVLADVAKGVLINRTYTTSSQTLANVRAYYALAITPMRGGTGGLYFTNYDADVPIIQSVNSSDVAQSLLLNPLGGNIGVGTVSPGYKLQVSGVQNANDIVINNTTTGVNLRMQSNDASSNVFTTGAIPLTLGTNNAERMRITNTGNVGVGLTSPNAKLHVSAGVSNVIVGPAVRITKGATNVVGNIRYDTLVIEANDVPTIRFGESDGTVSTIMSGDSNLRINSTSPIKFYTAGTTTGEGHDGQGGTLALTLTNSQNATFAGTINSGAITSTGAVGASNVFATAKMAVASSGVHGSYDFYNNGTSYFNGDVTVDANLTIDSATILNGQVNINPDSDSGLYIANAGANAISLLANTGDELYLGSNNSYSLRFKTNLDSIFENGNVGIGTDSPGARLDVVASNVSVTPNSESSAVFRRNGNNYISILSNSSNEGGILFGNSTDNNDASISYGHNTQAMSFATADSERMRITSAGDVGIGTSNPYAKLNVSGNIRAENGSFLAGRESAANPAFAFHDDGDTGMFNIASNILAFATGGAERMRIDSSGNIQFGSDKVIWSGSYGGALVIRGNNATSDRLIKMVTVDSDGVITQDNVLVAKGDKVGIGTDSPGAKLHTKVGTSGGSPYDNTVGVFAEGASRSIIQLSSTSDAYVMFGDAAVNNQAWLGYNHTTNQLSLHTGSTITMDGNIGINTTAPLAKLDVRGSIRSDQGGSGPDGTTDTTQIDQLIGDAGPDNMALGTPNQWLRINISGTDYVIPAYTAP